MKDLPILKDFINVKVKVFHLNMTLKVPKIISRVEYVLSFPAQAFSPLTRFASVQNQFRFSG